MFVISRKENEAITIAPAVDGGDSAMTLADAFAEGMITIKLTRVGSRRVRLVIDAPRAFRVCRQQPAPAGSHDGPATHGDSARPAYLRSVKPQS